MIGGSRVAIREGFQITKSTRRREMAKVLTTTETSKKGQEIEAKKAATKAEPKQKSSKRSAIQEKVKWVKANYSEKHLTRSEAVKGLIEKYNIATNYARTVVYSYCVALEGFSAATIQRAKHIRVMAIDFGDKNPDQYDANTEKAIKLLLTADYILGAKPRETYKKKK